MTPGLVDLHSHYCPFISGIGLPADELVGITASTTGVSPGDAGHHTFSAFRRWVLSDARTRLFAFVHISAIGLTGNLGAGPGEMMNIEYADVERCAKTLDTLDSLVGRDARSDRRDLAVLDSHVCRGASGWGRRRHHPRLPGRI